MILQIISQKDEHCWVGELNGLRGEFSNIHRYVLKSFCSTVHTETDL